MAPSTPGDLFSQYLATQQYDWQVECAKKTGLETDNRFCRFVFKRVECDKQARSRRAVKVFCDADCEQVVNGRIVYTFTETWFSFLCDPGTFCETIYLINKTPDGGPIEEVGCTDEKAVKQDIVVHDRTKAQPRQEKIHCGLELSLPGHDLQADPNQEPVDIILTEHVLKLDQSSLDVPVLLIRDSTNPKAPIDRVWRSDANVASALVEIGSYRGKLQQRKYEFCMQMPPSYVASAAIFVYSYVQVPRRHGWTLARRVRSHNDVSLAEELQ